ncbi:hypothetical protein H4F18_11105 [Vibrio scophthalmi]|uniref:hypothetical protein n=1 Tax=Vibrio scophthalmi TaxID=45658 RepID=UPI002FF05276
MRKYRLAYASLVASSALLLSACAGDIPVQTKTTEKQTINSIIPESSPVAGGGLQDYSRVLTEFSRYRKARASGQYSMKDYLGVEVAKDGNSYKISYINGNFHPGSKNIYSTKVIFTIDTEPYHGDLIMKLSPTYEIHEGRDSLGFKISPLDPIDTLIDDANRIVLKARFIFDKQTLPEPNKLKTLKLSQNKPSHYDNQVKICALIGTLAFSAIEESAKNNKELHQTEGYKGIKDILQAGLTQEETNKILNDQLIVLSGDNLEHLGPKLATDFVTDSCIHEYSLGAFSPELFKVFGQQCKHSDNTLKCMRKTSKEIWELWENAGQS